MPWQPPIPQGALWSKPMRGLGPAKALVEYCYDIVRRDGWCHFKLVEVADAMGEPYVTVKRWWKTIEDANDDTGIFAEMRNRGRLGLELRFADRWLDWRILGQRSEPEGPKEVSKVIPLPQEEGSEKVSKVILFNGIAPEIGSEIVSKEGSEVILLEPAYKVLIDSDQAPPPPPTPSTPEPAQPAPGTAPSSAGGGGGRWREHEVYRLLRGAGIAAADRLMPAWNGVPPEQVEALLTRLRKELWSADGEGRIAGRIYRAMLDGPELLLKPPARAAPTPIPRPPAAARGDPRAIAALLLEGRPNGKPNAE